MRSELARGEGNRSVCGTDRELVEETAHRHCTRVGIATTERCSRVSAPPPRGHHRKWVVEGSVVHHSHEGQAWKGQRRILGREEPCRMGGGGLQTMRACYRRCHGVARLGRSPSRMRQRQPMCVDGDGWDGSPMCRSLEGRAWQGRWRISVGGAVEDGGRRVWMMWAAAAQWNPSSYGTPFI
jgi:hypothetical protein